MKQVPLPPPQLSFNFDKPLSLEVKIHEAWVVAGAEQAPSNQVHRVLDLSAALSKKQESRTRLLYHRILDSVKHIG